MRLFCLRQARHQWFYNQPMRHALLLALSLSLSGVGVCHAQSPAPTQAPVDRTTRSTAAKTGAIEQRAERIHIEDADSSIDELRVGGETKRISVQPKGGMPAYQIQPASGERSWKILGF
jgi:hypothetical protein